MRYRLTSLVPVLALAGNLAAADPRTDGAIDPEFDYHSYANTDQFRQTRLDLDIRIFIKGKGKSIDGVAALEFKRLDPKATQIILDTRGLLITGVSQKAIDVLGATSKSQTTWVSRPYHLEKPDKVLGSALVIDLPPSGRGIEVVRINYETGDDAVALQWLDPGQTAGRKKPFLYTQSESIGARSWIPLQDTP
jgi:leukotriene-A4 hydrolase